MQPKLIILRGNSGSGETTVASALHQCLKEQSLLISQDMVRREVLRVKDETVFWTQVETTYLLRLES